MAVSITGAGFATINDGCGGALFIAQQKRRIIRLWGRKIPRAIGIVE
jgi:hypothetical protein